MGTSTCRRSSRQDSGEVDDGGGIERVRGKLEAFGSIESPRAGRLGTWSVRPRDRD
jgi:hypothetical protein